MRYILILFFLPIAIVTSCQNEEQTKIIRVTQDTLLIQRIYYKADNEKKQLISKVYLNGRNHLLDSIRFIRDKNEKVIAKDVYQYKNGVFEKQIIGSGTFSEVECDILSRITKPQFYLRDLSDICIITSATLPEGGVVADKIKSSNDGDTTTIYAENINARFRGLSLEIESFFYNELLHSFKFQFQDEKLLTEKYVFEEGTLQRIYYYDFKELTVTIKANYKNGDKKTINMKYFIL
jgi:hypothetical protein